MSIIMPTNEPRSTKAAVVCHADLKGAIRRRRVCLGDANNDNISRFKPIIYLRHVLSIFVYELVVHGSA